ELPTYICVPSHEVGASQAGPHAGFLGRRYEPFLTTCKPYVDNPPDDIWSPQVVRGEPVLTDVLLREGITLDRLQDRRRLGDQLDDQFPTAETLRGLRKHSRQP